MEPVMCAHPVSFCVMHMQWFQMPLSLHRFPIPSPSLLPPPYYWSNNFKGLTFLCTPRTPGKNGTYYPWPTQGMARVLGIPGPNGPSVWPFWVLHSPECHISRLKINCHIYFTVLQILLQLGAITFVLLGPFNKYRCQLIFLHETQVAPPTPTKMHATIFSTIALTARVGGVSRN